MNHIKNHVKEKFNENAPHYDQQRRKLIPCFDDFYSVPLSLINFEKEQPSVLDIGAGTGLFASFVKEKYPGAHITLIDLSENMMALSKERFKGDPQVDYVIADYTVHEFNKPFDLIISSLSIHHLTDTEKRKLYDKVFSLLHPNGIFINADQVLGHTPFIESLYKRDWKHKIEASGLKAEEIQAAYERTNLDQMAPLQDQLDWLQASGFVDVDCIYKYFNFVVLFGRKL
ncbi:class I SAM-dependent methyltransferase [Pseudobacillus wudalianchiensis]|uniref:Methyltransferase n=1 Tax=Pseudobacillus wudalianchiensis TaxID=1743143 RepID=A0A1B9AMZ6_9BACI|nr:class I SAM-dependent methyltransferase [Bacillus wudalianchiensis]OCA85176.1 methyltransferase [Bacillus wudalianchiensis]